MIHDVSYFMDYTIWVIPEEIAKNSWLIEGYFITLIVFLGWKWFRFCKWEYLHRILFVETILFIIYKTIIARTVHQEVGINLIPFWSYLVGDHRGTNLFIQNIMNILLYIPVGIFACGAFPKFKMTRIVLIGFTLSVLTDVSQLITKRGFCETDDVIHNTLGCMIGYGIYRFMKVIIDKLKKKC